MRVLFFLMAFILALFGAQKAYITQTDGKTAHITPVTAPIGISGIVVHHFDTNHSTILARAILTSKNSIAFSTFKALAQPNLPRPNMLPQKKDEVILGYLADRALIIAPNYSAYEAITSSLDRQWLHPDLFAAELAKSHHPAPSKEDFENFCDKFALSQIIFALEHKGVVVDCYSFAKLKEFPIHYTQNSLKLPFYSRIEKIRGSLFSFFTNEGVKDYFHYYQKMLEER